MATEAPPPFSSADGRAKRTVTRRFASEAPFDEASSGSRLGDPVHLERDCRGTAQRRVDLWILGIRRRIDAESTSI